MDLPFTPTFFKKLDIYQQLLDDEKVETIDSTWNEEKLVLRWAISSENTAKGSSFTIHRIKDILEKVLGKQIGFDQAQNVFDALAIRGFIDKSTDDKGGVFNNRAYLAGRIISETKDFKSKKYYVWIKIWWIIFWVGVFLLILEVLARLKDLGAIYFFLKTLGNFLYSLQ